MKSPEQIREKIEEIKNPNMPEFGWATINVLRWVLEDKADTPEFILETTAPLSHTLGLGQRDTVPERRDTARDSGGTPTL